jgi:hypothetical protein
MCWKMYITSHVFFSVAFLSSLLIKELDVE